MDFGVATLGISLGIDGTLLHRIAGVLLIAFGAVMAVPLLQRGFASATARSSGRGSAALARVSGAGPTLGATSTLAGEGHRLAEVAALMLVFASARRRRWSCSAGFRSASPQARGGSGSAQPSWRGACSVPVS